MDSDTIVSATQFIEMVCAEPNSGLRQSVRGLQISGAVFLDKRSIWNCDWEGCRFLGGLSIMDCEMFEMLDLADAMIDGSWAVENLNFTHNQNNASIRAPGIRVSSDVRIHNVIGGHVVSRQLTNSLAEPTTDKFIYTGIDLSSAQLGGSCVLAGCTLSVPAIYLRRIRVEGDLHIGVGFKSLVSVDAVGMQISGDVSVILTPSDQKEVTNNCFLDISDLQAGSLSVATSGAPAQIEISAERVVIAKNVSLDLGRAREELTTFSNGAIGGSFRIRNAVPIRDAAVVTVCLNQATVSGSIDIALSVPSVDSPQWNDERSLVSLYLTKVGIDASFKLQLLGVFPTEEEVPVGQSQFRAPPVTLVQALLAEIGGELLLGIDERSDLRNMITRKVFAPNIFAELNPVVRRELGLKSTLLNFRNGKARDVRILGVPLGMTSAIDLSGLQAGTLYVTNAFSAYLNVSWANLERMVVDNAVIYKGLEAVGLKVRENLLVSQAYIFPAMNFSFCEARRIVLDGCQSPSFVLNDAHITGKVAILKSRIGEMNFRGSTISEGIESHSAHLGHVDMTRLVSSNVVIWGEASNRRPRSGSDQIRLFGQLEEQVKVAIEMGTRSTGESLIGSLLLNWAKVDNVDVSATRFTCSAPTFGDDVVDKGLAYDAPPRVPVAILDSIVANTLTFGRESFELLENRAGPLLDLSGSTVKAISIASLIDDKLLSSPARWREITPSPIRLSGAVVSSWASTNGSLDDASTPEEYLALFECIDGFEPSMLQRVEQMYAEKGNLGAADIVYVERRRRARRFAMRTHRSRFHAFSASMERFSDYLNEVLFGYGTRIKQWIAVAAALWLLTFSGLLFNYTQIFRLSTEFLANLSDASGIPAVAVLPLTVSKCKRLDVRTPIGASRPERWIIDMVCEAKPADDPLWTRAANAGLIATANHLPMLGLEPAPQLMMTGKIFGIVPTQIWLQLMRIFNWILLPVLLAVTLSRLLPKRYGGGI